MGTLMKRGKFKHRDYVNTRDMVFHKPRNI
jgi:hypothetical protein